MQQQPWQPPTAPAPRRKSNTGLKIVGIGCGGLVLVVVALAVLGAVVGTPKSTPTTAVAAPAPSSAARSTSAAPKPPAKSKAAKAKAGPNVGSELRDLDIADGVNVEPTPTYEQAFTELSAKCQEQGVGLGNEVGAVLKLLQQNGVNDENRLTVMQHMATSIPGPQKMRCAEIGAAYVTLRTSGH